MQDKLLSLETKYNIEWREFKIEELFEKIPTKKLPFKAKDLKNRHDEIYNIPALTAGILNQGLAYYVPENGATILKNVISVSANGANSGAMFYQPKDFTVLQDSYAIKYIHAELKSYDYIYLVGALQKSIRGKFDWSNKAGWERIKSELIKLPISSSGNIAFEYMEDFVQTLEAERIQTLEAYMEATGLKDYNLTPDEQRILTGYKNTVESVNWNKFTLKQLFGNATRGKRLKSTDRIPGNLPFVTAGEINTGISAFIGNDVQTFKSNTFTIDMFGSAKYRNYEYGGDDHVSIVHTEKLSKSAAIFITAVANHFSNTGKFDYSKNFYAKDADELEIVLPIIRENVPDYKYMETIISAIQKVVIKNLVEWTAKKRINKTKND